MHRVLLVFIASFKNVSSLWYQENESTHLSHFTFETNAPVHLQHKHLNLSNTKAFLDRSFSRHLQLSQTQTTDRFLFLHPSKDQDLDMQLMALRGVLEPAITALWQGLVRHACASQSPAIVVDVGVNLGYYSTMSSQMGCKVIGFEPVPLFHEIAMLNIGVLNHPRSNVKIYPHVVSNDPTSVSICMPDATMDGIIMGTAGINGENSVGVWNSWKNNKICSNHIPISISEVIHDDVCLMKIDVEGMEPFVIRSAEQLLEKHTVQNLLVEFSPILTEKAGLPTRAELVQMLVFLSSKGYRVYELNWSIVKTDELIEREWGFAFEGVRRVARLILPDEFESFTTATSYNTNLWFCKDEQPGSLCRGCPP